MFYLNLAGENFRFELNRIERSTNKFFFKSRATRILNTYLTINFNVNIKSSIEALARIYKNMGALLNLSDKYVNLDASSRSKGGDRCLKKKCYGQGRPFTFVYSNQVTKVSYIHF